MYLHQRLWFNLRYHKKKSILFGFCAMLDAYYGIHSRIYARLTAQTLHQRLTKKIYKEMYPPSHAYCGEVQSTLPPAAKEVLIDYFLSTEAEVLRGLPRSMVVEFALRHELIDKEDKFLSRFYSASGFRQFVSELHRKTSRKAT